MAQPKLMLLDEPTLGLAPLMTRQIFQLVSRLVADGLTLLLAEQDVQQTLAASTQAYVVENGRIAAQGPAQDIADDPQAVAIWFNTAMGRIIRTCDEDEPGILDLSSKVGPDGPYLPINSARLTGYMRTERKDQHDLGDAIQAELELSWGVTQ
jgi:ABC-type multidrug transport system ATPase subunit